MEQLFVSGRIAEAIIVLMMIEGLSLLAYRRFSGRGLPPAQIITNLAAGACLFLAFHGALTNAGTGYMAACLGAALLAHIADLRARWPR